MMRRIGSALLATTLLTAAGMSDIQTGGQTTVSVTGRNAFSLPLSTLRDEELGRFSVGNSFFRSNWVEMGASTTARDGLGPHFDARSCGGCHGQDGRGSMPKADTLNTGSGLLLRLSVPGQDAHGGPKPHPVYGDQLSPQAVQGVRPEGQFRLHWEAVESPTPEAPWPTLRQPRFEIENLGYGPLGAETLFSLRLAPQLMGVGLIDAIPESELLVNAQRQAASKGPVRGIANRVWDAPSQQMRVGRFGWKAGSATLAHQTAAAFAGDMGIRSPWFALPSCTAAQLDCLNAPDTPKLDIEKPRLADVVFYQSALAPVARRMAAGPILQQGQALFHRAGCAVCHRPSYRTAAAPYPDLAPRTVRGHTIWPYSDFLLHDMGDGLADGRPEYLATGRHWRTPPLWGIGLLKAVGGEQNLLHDGRAPGVLEAIAWHGGEAQSAREAVRRMDAAQRGALVTFVESL